MYPAQTSFIPITVALSKYIEANGFSGLYPYWYLGTTPVKYLIGPVVPVLMTGIHKFLPNFSLFELSYFTLITSYFALALGWGFFALRLYSGSATAKLSGSRLIGCWVAILSLILPWRFLATMAFGEVSAVLAAALTPWVLLAYARVQSSTRFASEARREFKVQSLVLPSLAFALLLLTNSTAAVPAIVGLFVLSISNFQFPISNFKRVAIVILVGWILTLWWYGPGYWLATLGAPSIGGKSALSAFVTLLNLLRGFVPVLLVVILVWWKVKPKTLYEKFTLLWLVIFGTLTLFRFMADPDFWMDWTAWVVEVEVGLTLLVGKLISNVKFQMSNFKFSSLKRLEIRNWKLEIGNSAKLWLPVFIILLIIGWVLAYQNRDFWMPRASMESSVEYRIANKLNEIVEPGETVFLSGTTAFWLNSLVDVAQVRGGRDEASLHPTWREVVWEVRQGNDASESLAWFRALGVDYLVIHTDNSSEYYHDFENWWKFEGVKGLGKVYEEDGDVVYIIE